MPHAPSSTIDITTWQIRVRHYWEPETEDHWENPSLYPFMREVLHESVHFWQVVGLPYFLRVTCAAYWDFQRVRASAFGQGGDRPVPLDKFELEPNRLYFGPYISLSNVYGQLSGIDILEGLARYWDIHLCGMRAAIDRLLEEGHTSQKEIDAAEAQYGPFFLADGLNYTDAALRFVFDKERLYNKAYGFTHQVMGREAFIVFPIIAYLALCSGGQSVTNFQKWVEKFSEEKPFKIPQGNFLQIWPQCFSSCVDWIIKNLDEKLYSSLTVYAKANQKIGAWGIATPQMHQFGLFNGHGVIDRYLQRYFEIMEVRNPDVHKDDIEIMFSGEFCLPGIPGNRTLLHRFFHPPVIEFADGKTWVDQSNWDGLADGLADDMENFSGELGAAVALTGIYDADSLQVRCPHDDCPWHHTSLCWKVSRYPDHAQNCHMPKLYREQMNLELPLQADWSVSRIDRPINQENGLLDLEIY